MNDKASNEALNFLHRYFDIFRKVKDTKTKRDLSLSLLFWRLVSKPNHSAQDLKRGSEVEQDAVFDFFSIPRRANFFTFVRNLENQHIAKDIDLALQSIEDSNVEVLCGVFDSLTQFSDSGIGDEAFRNRLAREAITVISDSVVDSFATYKNDSFFGLSFFERAIQVCAELSHKRSDAFCTSESLSSLVAHIVAPHPGESVYDPACGSASLLLACAQFTAEKSDGPFAISLNGQEVNAGNWAIAKMNVLTSNFSTSATLHLGDSIRAPRFLNADGSIKQFDVGVSNIPFSLKDWGADEAQHDPFGRFQWGVPPKSSGDYAFISQMLSSLNTNGRMAVIVPNGVLFRAGNEGQIRKSLIESNLIEAVIGLPAKLLYDTSIPCSVIFFRKNRVANSVLFVDASREFIGGKLQNQLGHEHISKISAVVNEWQTIAQYSCEVPLETIYENDFNLNISRYVSMVEERGESDIKALLGKQRRLKTELDDLNEQMDSLIEGLQLRE